MDYPNFKVLTVDNASSDGTADAVRKAYPQAEVLQNEKNLMYAGGNNVGIEFALEHGADWVTFTSGSTVQFFHERFDLPKLLKQFPQLKIASIGPETSKALAALKDEGVLETASGWGTYVARGPAED